MYQHIGTALERRTQGEILRVEPWGPHAADASVVVGEDGSARLVNGRITVDRLGRHRLLAGLL